MAERPIYGVVFNPKGVRWNFGDPLAAGDLPSQMKIGRRVAWGKFKLEAHYPNLNPGIDEAGLKHTEVKKGDYDTRKGAQDAFKAKWKGAKWTAATKKAYIDRRVADGSFCRYYEDNSPYFLARTVWDSGVMPGVHLMTKTKDGRTVRFAVAPSSKSKNSLTLIGSMVVPLADDPEGGAILCSGPVATLTAKGDDNEFKLDKWEKHGIECPKTYKPEEGEPSVQIDDQVPPKYRYKKKELKESRKWKGLEWCPPDERLDYSYNQQAPNYKEAESVGEGSDCPTPSCDGILLMNDPEPEYHCYTCSTAFDEDGGITATFSAEGHPYGFASHDASIWIDCSGSTGVKVSNRWWDDHLGWQYSALDDEDAGEPLTVLDTFILNATFALRGLKEMGAVDRVEIIFFATTAERFTFDSTDEAVEWLLLSESEGGPPRTLGGGTNIRTAQDLARYWPFRMIFTDGQLSLGGHSVVTKKAEGDTHTIDITPRCDDLIPLYVDWIRDGSTGQRDLAVDHITRMAQFVQAIIDADIQDEVEEMIEAKGIEFDAESDAPFPTNEFKRLLREYRSLLDSTNSLYNHRKGRDADTGNPTIDNRIRNAGYSGSGSERIDEWLENEGRTKTEQMMHEKGAETFNAISSHRNRKGHFTGHQSVHNNDTGRFMPQGAESFEADFTVAMDTTSEAGFRIGEPQIEEWKLTDDELKEYALKEVRAGHGPDSWIEGDGDEDSIRITEMTREHPYDPDFEAETFESQSAGDQIISWEEDGYSSASMPPSNVHFGADTTTASQKDINENWKRQELMVKEGIEEQKQSWGAKWPQQEKRLIEAGYIPPKGYTNSKEDYEKGFHWGFKHGIKDNLATHVRPKEAGIPSGQGKYKKEGWTVYTEAGAIAGFETAGWRLAGNTDSRFV